jgi:hypothetical protein
MIRDVTHALRQTIRGRTTSDPARPRITRRRIQITLGLLWILDGGLQFQPAMLTRKFATQVIAPAGQGQPGFISGPVAEAARIILHQPAVADVGFGLIQLALGAGLLYPRTVRWALAASMAWALSVWYLGEGLGDLFGSGSSLLTGAPGAALLYAVLALAAAPRPDKRAEAQRPARWAALAWAMLWLGGAVLQMLPGRDTNASISMPLAMNASGAPGWLAAIDNHLSALLPYNGVSIVVDLVVLQAVIGLGVLKGGLTRQAAVLLGIGLSVVYWVTGQDMAQFWSGITTDPNTAPLIVLLGVTVLGSAPWRQPAGSALGLGDDGVGEAAEAGELLGQGLGVGAGDVGPAEADDDVGHALVLQAADAVDAEGVHGDHVDLERAAGCAFGAAELAEFREQAGQVC